MTFEAKGKKVLVTGASSGIGAALAVAFAQAGATVALVARREGRLAEVPDQLSGLDVLVNNAGIPLRRHVTDLTPDDVERAMAVNYLSPVRLTLALLPHLRQRPEAW